MSSASFFVAGSGLPASERTMENILSFLSDQDKFCMVLTSKKTTVCFLHRQVLIKNLEPTLHKISDVCHKIPVGHKKITYEEYWEMQNCYFVQNETYIAYLKVCQSIKPEIYMPAQSQFLTVRWKVEPSLQLEEFVCNLPGVSEPKILWYVRPYGNAKRLSSPSQSCLTKNPVASGPMNADTDDDLPNHSK